MRSLAIVIALALALPAFGQVAARGRKNGGSSTLVTGEGATGDACSVGSECSTGYCVDAVCCDTLCSGACAACSVAEGASEDGTCAARADEAVGSPSCSPYLCDGTSQTCPPTCSTSADCSSGYVCSASACIPMPESFTTILMSTGTECAGTPITATGGETITQTRASAGYCTDNAGAMTLRSTDEVRVSDKGVLIEDARTNYLTRSEALDHADWGGSAVITANQAAPPWTASTTMDNVASTALSNKYQCPSVPGGSLFSASGFGRTAASTGNGALSVYCVSGSLSGGGGGGACLAHTETTDEFANPSGGQCFGTIPLTTTAARGTVRAICELEQSTVCAEVFGVHTGDGNKHWGGLQLENGYFSSSYIATAGTAVTRALDDIHFTPGVAISTAGCVSGVVTFGPVAPNAGRLIGGAGETGIYVENNDTITIGDGTNTVTVDPDSGLEEGAHLKRQSYAFRATWSGDEMSLTVNGVTQTGDFDGNMDMGTVYLGSQAAEANFLFGWLKNLKFGASAAGCL